VYAEANLQDGYRYLYKVRARAGGWYSSPDSNVVSFVWAAPPEAPQGVLLETGDRKITLAWQPVEENMDGRPLQQEARYQVYRQSGDGDFAALGEPVQDTLFIDDDLENARAETVLTDSNGMTPISNRISANLTLGQIVER